MVLGLVRLPAHDCAVKKLRKRAQKFGMGIEPNFDLWRRLWASGGRGVPVTLIQQQQQQQQQQQHSEFTVKTMTHMSKNEESSWTLFCRWTHYDAGSSRGLT